MPHICLAASNADISVCRYLIDVQIGIGSALDDTGSAQGTWLVFCGHFLASEEDYCALL